MKKILLLVLALVFVFAFASPAAYAEDVSVMGEWGVELFTSDDEIYEPDGGMAQVTLLVRNDSDTENIKYVSIYYGPGTVDVEQYKAVSISPHTAQYVIFEFWLDGSDLDSGDQLHVSMSQGGISETDGWGFINGISFSSPNYAIGIGINSLDPVIAAGAATDISMGINYMGNRNADIYVYDHNENLIETYNNVPPGSTLQEIHSYTFWATTTVVYEVQVYTTEGAGSYVNENYSNPLTITVAESAELDADYAFEATLSADETEIASGDEVTFTIDITNMGVDLSSFEITNMGGATIGNAAGLATGESGSTEITMTFEESEEVQFVVIGKVDDISVSQPTNIVEITIGDGTADEDADADQSGSNRLFLWLAIGLIVAALAVGGFFFYRHKKKSKKDTGVDENKETVSDDKEKSNDNEDKNNEDKNDSK